MAKHRAFNVDRFLDKFQGHEGLLKNYCRLWGRKLHLKIASLTVPEFKEWLVQGDAANVARDELMEELYRCYDLSTDHGHENLKSACRDFAPYDPDPEETLPVECLAVKVRTENEDAFNLAYAQHSLFHAERFSIYRGSSAKRIAASKKHINAFATALAKEFQKDKNSERVLVRSYREGDYTNLIVYHEKRIKSTLIFKGTKTKPKVAPTVFRPAQQDFISYNERTGQVEIEAAFEAEDEKLRKCFATSFFGDKEFFDGADSAKCLDLGELANQAFRLETPDGTTATLAQLRFKLKQEGGPSFDVRSKDVFRTLELNGLRRKLKSDMIQSAAFKIFLPGDNRGKRVELNGENKIKFNRATHADEVFRLLKDLGLLLTHEDEEENGSADDAVGNGARSFAHDGRATSTVPRNRALPKDRTTKKLRQKRPR
jgi:hypothetical protein